jgi:basic amino acid/polyamine antiporter, APA family
LSMSIGAQAAPSSALSVFDTAMIIVGIVIGGGIFSMPPLVAGTTGSVPWMMFAWLLGGVLSMVGALVYAELSTTFPSTGGDYHFLTRAYGRDLSFFFGWARALVTQPGSIALHVFIFGDYMTRVLPLGPHSSAVYAAATVVILTGLNLAGLRQSSRTQNLMTLTLLAGLVLIVVAALLVPAADHGAAAPASSPPTPGVFGLAMVFVLLTYGGWNEAAYVSAELKGGRRAIARALAAGLTIVTIAYLLVVTGLLSGLGFGALKNSATPAADLMQAAFGPRGAVLMAAIVSLSILSSINATMISGARSNHALGGDWPILGFMHRWDQVRGVPTRAFVVQAVLALGLIALGAFEQAGVRTMVEFTAPVFWFFFMLTGVALFVLRAREPLAARPFRVPAYPIVPMIFVLTCAYLFWSSTNYAQSQHAVHVSLMVMAVGAVAWVVAFVQRRRAA